MILNTYDNRGDNVETTNAAKKAIEVGGADVIVGCNSSGASLALASVCEEYKVPSVATCATNSKVTESALLILPWVMLWQSMPMTNWD